MVAFIGEPTSLEADEVFRTAVVAYQHSRVLDFVWDGFFADHRVGDVLLEPKWDVILPSRNLDDLKKRMGSLDDLVMRIIAAGGRVQLNFQGVPRWLSSDPRNEGNLVGNEKIWYSVPPSDYRRWQELMRSFVHHFNNELDTRGRVYYVIGNEPDNYWLGSEGEFLRYYEHAVRGALEADSAARIGGITPSSHDANIFSTTGKRTADGRPLLYRWIRHSREKNLPLHIVTWHSYPAASPVPGTTTFWGQAARDVRGWLDEFGYDDVELHISDWPEWKVHPENDTEFKASWVASSLISMLADGLYNPTYLGLRDTEVDLERSRQNASFGGGNGLVTKFGLHKPVYDVYGLFSRLEGRIVTVDTGDEFLQAVVAVESRDRIAVLLSHFIPSPWLMPRNVLDEQLDPDRMKREFKELSRKGHDMQRYFRQVMEGIVSIDDLTASDDFKKYLRGLRALNQKGRTRIGAPIEIQLTLNGVEAGTWRRSDTVVDREHGNLFTRRQDIVSRIAPAVKRQDQVAVRRMVLEINEQGAAKTESRGPVSVPSGSSTLSLEATMASHSVVLIELSRNQRPGRKGVLKPLPAGRGRPH